MVRVLGFVLLVGLLLMVDDFKSSVFLSKLDRRHASRQAKKDERFQTDLSVVFSDQFNLDREALRKARDRKYIEDTFTVDDDDDVVVGVDDL